MKIVSYLIEWIFHTNSRTCAIPITGRGLVICFAYIILYYYIYLSVEELRSRIAPVCRKICVDFAPLQWATASVYPLDKAGSSLCHHFASSLAEYSWNLYRNLNLCCWMVSFIRTGQGRLYLYRELRFLMFEAAIFKKTSKKVNEFVKI